MMHIDPQPEPAKFDKLVRKPGRKFLKGNPNPKSKEFPPHWRKVLHDLYEAYGGICAYSCHWIPYDTGADTVEHFQSKVKYPDKAYEWDNYRLVCSTLNGRKGENEDVLDPFMIQNEWFILDFPSLLIKPAPNLDRNLASQVVRTRDLLGLNDEGTCLKSRLRYVKDYCDGLPLSHLRRDAPFIAQQLQHSGLEDLKMLREVMGYE